MKTGTILMVLDDPQDLQIYANSLRGLGYKVVPCVSRPAAVDLIESESADFAIISQGTPAFESRQMLERILKLHPRLPVLVVARAFDAHCYFEAMEMGAVDYLERPEPRDLQWIVETQMPNLGRVTAA